MNSTAIVESPTTYTEYPVDGEHGLLRLSIIVIFITLWIGLYFIFDQFIPSNGLNILAAAAAFGLTALLTQQIDRYLKQRWPSGRVVRISPSQIVLGKKHKPEEEINPTENVNVLSWRFTVSRRSHVRKGWYMVAVALEQDDKYIPVYTFMSPKDFEAMSEHPQFTHLQTKKELDDQRADMRLAGIQRRLHTAESIRWMHGAEMSPQDFNAYISQLQEQFPQWMPTVI